MRNKKIIWGSVLAVAASFVMAWGVFNYLPASSVTFDVNPSIEITTNRLSRVLSVRPLNSDARDLLDGFILPNRDLDEVINDLVDRMILTGHISGGEDNLVMITVKDGNADPQLLDKVNTIISAYLENKQIEATVFSQTIADHKFEEASKTDAQISPGKLELIRKLAQQSKVDSFDDLASVSLREILLTAEAMDITPEQLFERIIRNISSGSQISSGQTNELNLADHELIGMDQAIAIAREKIGGGGTVVEFELDWDDGKIKYEIAIEKEGKEYEFEIDAVSGQVLKYEMDDDEDYQPENESTDLIGMDQAIAIAREKIGGGGTVVEFELDRDDEKIKYEITIKKEGKEYAFEIDAVSGQILEYEMDDDEDYQPQNESSDLIGKDQAIAIAREKIGGGGTVVEFELDRDDEKIKYEITIKKEGKEYAFEIDAVSGQILEYEMDDDEDYQLENESSDLIGKDQAIAIAREKIGGGGTVVEFELDWDDEKIKYEITIEKEGKEYEFEIDAVSGQILEYEMDDDEDYQLENESSDLIGKDQAIAIAREKIGGGGTVVEFELDQDDGKIKYEIVIEKEGKEYDFEIDAVSGQILEFEMDD